MTLDKIKCFLLDMDGTLYLGNNLIEGAPEAVARMRQRARVLYVTNNSSVSAESYFTKLKKLGFDLDASDIYSSTLATIDYLKEKHLNKSVYLCATSDVTAEFVRAGVSLTDTNPDIVCLAFDKTLTYDKLEKICRFLKGGALFVATHPDKLCPTADGFIPDIGCFLRAIRCASGRSPDIICGKPNKLFGRRIIKLTGLKPRQIAMVGDRLSTDLRFAQNCGFVSVTVLSGEATPTDIKGLKKPPDIMLKSIAEWDKH